MRALFRTILLSSILASCTTTVPLVAPTDSNVSGQLSASPSISDQAGVGLTPISSSDLTLTAGTVTPPIGAAPTPLAWDRLDIHGRIYFITYDPASEVSAPFLVHLDLDTGQLVTDWIPPEGAWVTNFALSSDEQDLVIAYAPPPAEDKIQFGLTGLYRLPGVCLTEGCSGVEPEPLVPGSPRAIAINPVWSPDDQSIYFTRVSGMFEDVSRYQIERLPAGGGEPQRLLEDAMWPRLSPEASQLAFVARDLVESLNELSFATPDGRRAVMAFPLGAFTSVDAPLYSPDGAYLYFSASGLGSWGANLPATEARSWWERLTGIQPAEANGAPAEWWRLRIGAEQPEQLTEIGTPGLTGSFSADGTRLAFISSLGLAVLNLSNLQVTWMLPNTALGDVLWLPPR